MLLKIKSLLLLLSFITYFAKYGKILDIRTNMARESFVHVGQLVQSYRPARAFALLFKTKMVERKLENL